MSLDISLGSESGRESDQVGVWPPQEPWARGACRACWCLHGLSLDAKLHGNVIQLSSLPPLPVPVHSHFSVQFLLPPAMLLQDRFSSRSLKLCRLKQKQNRSTIRNLPEPFNLPQAAIHVTEITVCWEACWEHENYLSCLHRQIKHTIKANPQAQKRSIVDFRLLI